MALPTATMHSQAALSWVSVNSNPRDEAIQAGFRESESQTYRQKKGWDVTNPGAIEGDRVVFYSKMHDDQFATVAQIALAIIYGLLGPVVLVGELLFDWFWSTLKSN